MKALITGASSGIGRDIARCLAARNIDLIITARRGDRLAELKKSLEDKVRVKIITCDLNDEKNCFDLYEQTKDEDIDILINNAGFGKCGEFLNTDIQSELDMININIKAVHILTKLFLADFVKKDRGYILNVASSAAFLPGPLMSTYYSTKSYVFRLTQSIYQELKKSGSNVHVSALCPGPVATEFDKVADVKFSLKNLSSKFVASYAVNKLFKNKLTIIPGAQLKLAKFGLRFLPDKLILKIAYHMQKKKQ